MKKFILTLSLVVFGATVSAQEMPLNDTNPSKEVVAAANKKLVAVIQKQKQIAPKLIIRPLPKQLLQKQLLQEWLSLRNLVVLNPKALR